MNYLLVFISRIPILNRMYIPLALLWLYWGHA